MEDKLAQLIHAALEADDHIVVVRARVGSSGAIITFAVQILEVEDGEDGILVHPVVGQA